MFHIFAVVFIVIGASYAPVLAVIGGNLASRGQFPYQVSLEYQGRHKCGGTIISKELVITAAHCTKDRDPRFIKILAGTNNRQRGGTRYSIIEYKVHDFYDGRTPASYDIAIIKIRGSFTFGRLVAAVELPSKRDALTTSDVGTVSGWGAEAIGKLSILQLTYAKIPLWDRNVCLQYLPNLPISHLCAGDELGRRNACPGDSGGPLTIGNKLVGVVSYGFGCGQEYHPTMYTYVAGVRNWIRRHTRL